MGFWGMCLRGRRCGGDRGGAFCDGESLVGWDGSAKRTLDFDIFFFQQVRIIALDGNCTKGKWAGRELGSLSVWSAFGGTRWMRVN